MPPRITVGPVIGKVTDTSARILVETDTNVDQVTCVAQSGATEVRSQPRDLQKNQAAVFTLENLAPETEYQIEFSGGGISNGLPGIVRTYKLNSTKMNIGALSCNFLTRRQDTDLWIDLRDLYVGPGTLDLLLHLGDQVYADNAFQEALVEWNRARVSRTVKQKRVLELYRRLYRLTWNHPPTKEVLAQVPNLMIWDDHEICDDWGSREADKDQSSAEHQVGLLARQVFREYQRQLWDNGQANSPRNFECHLHVWGEIGVLFVDQRTGRSFEIDSARPYLGRAQWDWLKREFSAVGSLSSVRALIVVSSVPLAYLGDSITTTGTAFKDDLEDHWAFGSHQKEQIEMLRALRLWKKASLGREILVLGGDVHVGGHTEIEHEKKVIFKQMITSPITNRPPNWLLFQGLRLVLEAEERLGEGYSFEHSQFTRKRNFGLVLVRIPPNAKERPKIEGSLFEVS